MQSLRALIVFALFVMTLPLSAATEIFKVDKPHSIVEFRVRHIMSMVAGRFGDFSCTIEADRGNPANSTVEFVIQAASIDTGTADRDKHLRSADFFDVERYPTITFRSTKIAPGKNKDSYDVTGDLTIHGVTKRMTLSVELLGFAKDAWGNERAGFELATTINRKDFGINWNRALDQGGYLLQDEVKVSINLEVVKKKN